MLVQTCVTSNRLSVSFIEPFRFNIHSTNGSACTLIVQFCHIELSYANLFINRTLVSDRVHQKLNFSVILKSISIRAYIENIARVHAIDSGIMSDQWRQSETTIVQLYYFCVRTILYSLIYVVVPSIRETRYKHVPLRRWTVGKLLLLLRTWESIGLYQYKTYYYMPWCRG